MRPLFILVLLTGLLSGRGNDVSAADAKADYRVGERLTQPAPGVSSPTSYKETSWDMLVPEDWNPLRAFKGLNLGKLKDSDPRAIEALERMREMWSSAPVQTSLNGVRIRIAGFIIPLERQRNEIREFLLVPYFGACIHVPPPPANQIIYVIPSKPLKDAQTMDAFWVSGTLELAYADSPPWGASGYRMKADIVVPYTKH